MFTSILFAFLTSFIITYVAVPKVIFFADKFRLTDVPGERSSHKRSVPIFGGIAIFSGIIFSLIFWSEIDNSLFTSQSPSFFYFFNLTVIMKLKKELELSLLPLLRIPFGKLMEKLQNILIEVIFIKYKPLNVL